MAVSYNKLWKMLIDKGMKRTELRDAVDMSTNTLAKLGKNDYISLEILDRICTYLECDIGDVMEFVPPKGKPENPSGKKEAR
ncbi:MAG: helix-turn-helix transcriptional regulator [Lachnospiraceae bacterium]|nr:helix-turn-helix transcriptional regulator [Lachnospiraceae bacterium]